MKTPSSPAVIAPAMSQSWAATMTISEVDVSMCYAAASYTDRCGLNLLTISTDMIDVKSWEIPALSVS